MCPGWQRISARYIILLALIEVKKRCEAYLNNLPKLASFLYVWEGGLFGCMRAHLYPGRRGLAVVQLSEPDIQVPRQL